jgi:hypothetical protein
MNLSLEQTLELVVSYLDKNGVVANYNDIYTHILSTQKNTKKTKKIKLKPIKTNLNPNENNIPNPNLIENNTKHIDTTTKEKPKPKKIRFKQIPIKKDFQRFVDICNEKSLYYFQFNDELNWKGPSIKIDIDTFDLSIFGDIDIHILEGYGFGIVRPKNYESDKHIVYNEMNYETCKLMNEDILSLNGSEDESENDIYNASTDEEEVLTEDWIFSPDNTIYQLDTKTNNIYCNQTNQHVGKKIDDFNIDYDSKEHESLNNEA